MCTFLRSGLKHVGCRLFSLFLKWTLVQKYRSHEDINKYISSSTTSTANGKKSIQDSRKDSQLWMFPFPHGKPPVTLESSHMKCLIKEKETIVMVTDRCVTARPMSLLRVWGELLCMVTSVKDVTNVKQTKREHNDETQSQDNESRNPVPGLGTHCPAQWGWQASCTGPRMVQGQASGRTAVASAVLGSLNCSYSRWCEQQLTIYSSCRPCRDPERNTFCQYDNVGKPRLFNMFFSMGL